MVSLFCAHARSCVHVRMHVTSLNRRGVQKTTKAPLAAAVTDELPGRQLDVDASPHLRPLGLCQAGDVLSVPHGDRER